MRNVALWLTGSLAILAYGCTGGAEAPIAPSSSSLPNTPGAAASDSQLGVVQISNDLAQSAVGIYTVTIDPETMSSTVQLKDAQRQVSESEIYNLEIGTFLTADSFKIDEINLTPTTLDVTYSVTHPIPFPADPCGVANAGNRLDLAVSGRVLWLLDGSDGNTYFAGDGDYEANTSLILNPDGYFQPGGMVDSSALATNTFPYQEIIDESADGTGNRVGVSNSGNVHGNYPGTTSWTQAHYTAGITGYGIWGQGQTAQNTISMDSAIILGGTPFTTDVAILVKYEDPRGAGTSFVKRGNRLPCGNNPITGDPRELVYRAPHFSLDVSVVDGVVASDGFLPSTASSATVDANVVDWDNAATEHATTNLADATDTSLVSAGESGAPIVDVDIPGIAGAMGDALTAGAGTGESGDPLAYTGVVDGTPGVAGVYTGMVRATDVVDVTPPADWATNHFNLAFGGTLQPVTPNTEGSVLQSFTVNVITPCANPITQGTRIHYAQLETVAGDDAYVPGQLFSPPLPNNDSFGWSQFTRCATAIGGMPGGFSYHTGPDGGFCGSFNNDYAPGLDNNVVSPIINLSSATAASIRYDRFMTDPATKEVYVSTDNGATWGTALTVDAGTTGLDLDETISIDAATGNAQVRLRFRVHDASFFGGGSPIAGMAIDDIEVWTCP